MPTWAFAKLQTARHSRYSRHPFHAGPHFGASLVRSCYGLLGCSSPWTDQTRTLPASGDFYFQAFDELVTLLIAGYNYGSHWTPLPAGLSPAGITASFAALQPRGAHTEWKLLFLCNLFPLHAAYGGLPCQASGDFDRHTSFQIVINEICLLTFQRIRSRKRNIQIGIVKRLTTNLNPFYKGGAMKRLLKPRVSKEFGVLFIVIRASLNRGVNAYAQE